MDQLATLLLLLPVLLAGLLYLEKKRRGVDPRHLPPAPPGLPIIGNLHQVGAIPHRALRALAAANGAPHLMRLRLGHVPALVASSPAAAAELMRAHDHVFATRPYIRAAEIMTYGFQDMVFAPHGEHWRHVRRLCSEHVLSSSRSRRQNPMREQEVAALVQAVAGQASSHAGAEVDVSGALYRFAHDVICRVVCGRHSREEAGRSELFRELIKENAALMGGFRVGDYFPALAWADALLPGAGGGTRAWRNARRWDELLEKVVQEHEGRRGGRGEDDDDGGKEEDFVDVLLALQEEGGQEGFELSRETVKSLMGDMFAAGTDTTYIVLEWAMSELMKNPSTMRKLEHEVRSRSAGGIAKADMLGAATTPYLKAVVKETLRLHPPTPLLLPRECMQDATVMGYHVAKGTLVFVNAWAINRDPASWHAPDEFLPERFLESEVDFRGGHFQFIPFGAGRRICPGMQFGLATMELALANLVRMFDWELPDAIAPGELDMSDTPGLTTPRRVGLRLIARPYQWEKQE